MHTTRLVIPALLAVAVPEVASQSCDQSSGTQCLVGFVGYFADSNCATSVGGQCMYAGDVNQNCAPNLNANSYQCISSTLPNAPFYAKISDAQYSEMEVEFYENTNDCTSASPPCNVNAVVHNNNDCVQVNIGGANHGIFVAPQGLSGASKKRQVNRSTPSRAAIRRAALQQLRARDDLQCDGWEFGSQQDITTAKMTVSTSVNCAGMTQDCSISAMDQHTTSITTMYSVTAGGSVEGLTASATFGMSYTDSVTSSIQESISVPAGSDGFLQVHSDATMFRGTFTGCNTSNGVADGTVIAIKSGTENLHYEVTTN